MHERVERRHERALSVEAGAVSPILLALIGAVAAALVFAVVGLSIGLTKGSPAADKQRVTSLEQELTSRKQQLKSARDARSSAVEDAHAAAARAEAFRANFTQMVAISDQIATVASQIQAAGVAGNVPLVNQLESQLGSLVQQHNTVTTQSNALPRV